MITLNENDFKPIQHYLNVIKNYIYHFSAMSEIEAIVSNFINRIYTIVNTTEFMNVNDNLQLFLDLQAFFERYEIEIDKYDFLHLKSAMNNLKLKTFSAKIFLAVENDQNGFEFLFEIAGASENPKVIEDGLYLSAKRDNERILKEFLDTGFTVNYQTLLKHAIEFSTFDTIHLILEYTKLEASWISSYLTLKNITFEKIIFLLEQPTILQTVKISELEKHLKGLNIDSLFYCRVESRVKLYEMCLLNNIDVSNQIKKDYRAFLHSRKLCKKSIEIFDRDMILEISLQSISEAQNEFEYQNLYWMLKSVVKIPFSESTTRQLELLLQLMLVPKYVRRQKSIIKYLWQLGIKTNRENYNSYGSYYDVLILNEITTKTFLLLQGFQCKESNFSKLPRDVIYLIIQFLFPIDFKVPSYAKNIKTVSNFIVHNEKLFLAYQASLQNTEELFLEYEKSGDKNEKNTFQIRLYFARIEHKIKNKVNVNLSELNHGIFQFLLKYFCKSPFNLNSDLNYLIFNELLRRNNVDAAAYFLMKADMFSNYSIMLNELAVASNTTVESVLAKYKFLEPLEKKHNKPEQNKQDKNFVELIQTAERFDFLSFYSIFKKYTQSLPFPTRNFSFKAWSLLKEIQEYKQFTTFPKIIKSAMKNTLNRYGIWCEMSKYQFLNQDKIILTEIASQVGAVPMFNFMMHQIIVEPYAENLRSKIFIYSFNNEAILSSGVTRSNNFLKEFSTLKNHKSIIDETMKLLSRQETHYFKFWVPTGGNLSEKSLDTQILKHIAEDPIFLFYLFGENPPPKIDLNYESNRRDFRHVLLERWKLREAAPQSALKYLQP